MTDFGKYHSSYFSKILNRKQISYSAIEPGMVIELHYNKAISATQKELKHYMVFVLSTKQVPGVDERFIYGLSLENISPYSFTRLIDKIGLTEMSAKLYKQKKVMYPKADLSVKDHPKIIYNKYIKPRLDTTLYDSYRMFKKDNSIKIFAVDFKWSNILVEKYLRGDKTELVEDITK